jgi:outer membrane murein-binding lipoprotein Lpp
MGRTIALLAAGLGLAGCTDLTPIQRDLMDLHGQLDHLATEVRSVRASADSAMQSAQQARQAASAATDAANRALAMARADQTAIDATNEKLDRMFRHHLSK